MATAGYSGTPLLKKLGIKPGDKLVLINRPENYFELLEADVTEQVCTNNEPPDLIHLFAVSKKEFESEMKGLGRLIKKNKKVVVWVSWLKRSSGIATDLTEDTIRNFALKNNLVDVKVCAVSDIWSGLKLVVPLKAR
jgi:bifunctional DNA-binding transcriptional regulator/antitoxin component of YhaV-PrlF toxin-antitoxin module